MTSPLTFPAGRGALPRLGACLLLAVLTTFACKLLLETAFRPRRVGDSLLRQLASAAGPAAFWCMVLMPRGNSRVLSRARAHPSAAPLLALVLLLASAAVLTSCTDLAFEWGVSARLKRDVVLPSAWATNVLILFCAYALVFAATSRVAAADCWCHLPMWC